MCDQNGELAAAMIFEPGPSLIQCRFELVVDGRGRPDDIIVYVQDLRQILYRCSAYQHGGHLVAGDYYFSYSGCMSTILDDPTASLAVRIRFEREAREWSLAALAARSGVSK